MKKTKTRPGIVDDSLKAIQNIDGNAALRQGLANTMAAVLHGEISADDASVIAKAAKRRRISISRGVLKG